jgi:hypothetical protein
VWPAYGKLAKDGDKVAAMLGQFRARLEKACRPSVDREYGPLLSRNIVERSGTRGGACMTQNRNGAWTDRLLRISGKLTAERVTAGAAVVTALGVVVAALTYIDQERTSRLQRTFQIMAQSSRYLTDKEFDDLKIAFVGRWNNPVGKPISLDEAQMLFRISPHPESEGYQRYDLVRKYLNAVETIAFAYVKNLADDELLAQLTCPSVAKSSRYFQQVIAVFGRELGETQSWQVIPQAVKGMESRYGQECAKLFSQEGNNKSH